MSRLIVPDMPRLQEMLDLRPAAHATSTSTVASSMRCLRANCSGSN
jgi:hypothetical protein